MGIIYAGAYPELFGWLPPDVVVGDRVELPLPGAFAITCDLDNVDSGEELWVHGKFRTLNPANTTTAAPVLQVFAGNVIFSAPIFANFPKLAARVTTISPIGSTIGIAYPFVASPTTYFFDLRCRFSGGNAICELYANNALVSTASRAAAPQNFQTASWGNDLGQRSFGGSGTVFVEEMIVATEDTRGRTVEVLSASGGAGTYSEWSGDSANLADFLPLTGVTASSSGLRESRIHDPALGGDIRAIIVATRFLPSPSAARLTHFFRIGGDDFYAGAAASPSVGAPAQVVKTVFDVNPATDLPWTSDDIAALEAGFRSELPA